MAQKYSVGDVEFGAEAGFLAAGDQSILFLADGKKCRAVYDGTINEVRHKLAAMGWVPVVRTERVARFRAPTTEEVAERERAEEPRLSAKAIMATVRNLVGLSTPEPREGKGPSAQCNKRREARAALVAERMPLDSPHVGMNVDTGHAHISGNTRAYLEMFGQRVHYMHLDDNDGIGDSHVAPSAGTIDWAQLFEWMAYYGVEGSFGIEFNENNVAEELPILRNYAEKYEWRQPRAG